MHIFPALRLRAPLRAEIFGIDMTYSEYGYDYVEASPEPGYDLEQEWRQVSEGQDLEEAHHPYLVAHPYDVPGGTPRAANGSPVVPQLPHTPYAADAPAGPALSKQTAGTSTVAHLMPNRLPRS